MSNNSSSTFVISDKVKFVISIFVIFFLALLLVKTNYDLYLYENNLNQSLLEMKRLRDEVTRSSSSLVTKKDLNKFSKDVGLDLKEIIKDLSDLNAKMVGVNNVSVVTPGVISRGVSGTSEDPSSEDSSSKPYKVKCNDGSKLDCPDPFGYLSTVQVLRVSEPFGGDLSVPFGRVKFRSWKKKPWDLEVYPRSYSLTTVLGHDVEGKHIVYNKFSIKANGNDHPIKITNSKFLETFPDPEFRLSPRVYLGVDAGAHVNPAPKAEVTPNLQVSIFSYGRTKINPKCTFLGVGLGFESQDKKLGVILSPVNYNVAKHIPFMDNVYVGPSVSVNTSGSFSVLAGVKVGL